MRLFGQMPARQRGCERGELWMSRSGVAIDASTSPSGCLLLAYKQASLSEAVKGEDEDCVLQQVVWPTAGNLLEVWRMVRGLWLAPKQLSVGPSRVLARGHKNWATFQWTWGRQHSPGG